MVFEVDLTTSFRCEFGEGAMAAELLDGIFHDTLTRLMKFIFVVAHNEAHVGDVLLRAVI